MIRLRHLPTSEEQSIMQALAFEVIKYGVAHYQQLLQFGHKAQ